MRAATALRLSWSTWLLAGFVVLAVADLQGTPYDDLPYGLTLTSHAMASIFVIAPLAALCAARDGARLRSAHWLDTPRTRPWPRVVLGEVWVTLAVAILVPLLVTVVRVGPGRVDVTVVAVGLAAVAAWVAAGFALGLALPQVAALPLAAVVSYLWFTLPLGLEPLWVRQLTGAWYSCCAIDTQLSSRAVIGSLLVSAGLTAAAVALLALRRDRRLGAATALVALLGFVIPASVTASPLGATPSEPRAASVLCRGEAPRVCVFPEQSDELRRLADIGARAYVAWHGSVGSLPTRLSADTTSARGHLVVGSDADELDVISSLAVAVVPDVRPCPEDVAWPGARDQELARLWLVLRAYPHVAQVADRHDETDVRTAARGAALPHDEAATWFHTRMQRAARCGA